MESKDGSSSRLQSYRKKQQAKKDRIAAARAKKNKTDSENKDESDDDSSVRTTRESSASTGRIMTRSQRQAEEEDEILQVEKSRLRSGFGKIMNTLFRMDSKSSVFSKISNFLCIFDSVLTFSSIMLD